MSVKRLQREAAGVDLAAFGHELHQRVVEVLMSGECLVADLGKTALDAEGDAGAIQQDRGLETLAHQARGLQHVDEADRAFEGDRVKRHQGFFTGVCFDVFENFLFVVDQDVALFASGYRYGWHGALLALARTSSRAEQGIATDVPIDVLPNGSSK